MMTLLLTFRFGLTALASVPLDCALMGTVDRIFAADPDLLDAEILAVRL